jgi:hypothetical protein
MPADLEWPSFAITVDETDCFHIAYTELFGNRVVYANDCDGEWREWLVARVDAPAQVAIAPRPGGGADLVYTVLQLGEQNDDLWYVRIPENLSGRDRGTPVQFGTANPPAE